MSSSNQTAAVAAAVATAGKQTHPLLAAYLAQLAIHPLRTKAVTLGVHSSKSPKTHTANSALLPGTLQLLQEVLASHIAGVPAKRVPKDAPFYQHALARAKFDTKALKMALYGFFISAPLGHFLVGLLQKVFAGRTDVKAKVGQILASNLLVAPIQVSGESALMSEM